MTALIEPRLIREMLINVLSGTYSHVNVNTNDKTEKTVLSYGLAKELSSQVRKFEEDWKEVFEESFPRGKTLEQNGGVLFSGNAVVAVAKVAKASTINSTHLITTLKKMLPGHVDKIEAAVKAATMTSPRVTYSIVPVRTQQNGDSNDGDPTTYPRGEEIF